MSDYRNKSSSRILNTAASLMLFLIFAVCMLVIIGAGAGIYSRINSGYETTYGSSAAIRYISNKIRAADKCEIIEEGKGVALLNGNVMCVIYSESDGIYEKNISADSEVVPNGGELVIETQEFCIKETDGLYEISVKCQNSDLSAFIRKGDFSE